MSVNDIKNYMVWSILSVLMFWPTGIPAVVNAIKVNSAKRSGDLVLAQDASARAKKWCKISTIIYGIVMVLAVISIIISICYLSQVSSSYYY